MCNFELYYSLGLVQNKKTIHGCFLPSYTKLRVVLVRSGFEKKVVVKVKQVGQVFAVSCSFIYDHNTLNMVFM